MVSISSRRVTIALLGTTLALPLVAVEAQAKEAAGTVYVIQGVAGSSMAITVDGKSVAGNAAAKTILGPLTLSAGNHTVSAKSPTGTDSVTATVTVAGGANLDAVVHRQVDPSKPPVITTFPNDLSTVAAGSGRVAVAHTAAVGPADVRVNKKVLFANIANGEALTLTVPAGTYSVDIVPTATSGPIVFGPADVKVAPTSLTRVFAIGVAATNSMDAIVQVLPLAARGAGTPPQAVNAGDGGQAEPLIAAASGQANDTPGLIAFGALGSLLVAAALGSRRRGAHRGSGTR